MYLILILFVFPSPNIRSNLVNKARPKESQIYMKHLHEIPKACEKIDNNKKKVYKSYQKMIVMATRKLIALISTANLFLQLVKI